MARSSRILFVVATISAITGGVLGTLAAQLIFGAEDSSSLPPEPVATRPLLFTDWTVDDGDVVWVESRVEDSFLWLTPNRRWTSLDLRPEVLEDSGRYRGLELEVYAAPHSAWRLAVMIFYEEFQDGTFKISPVADRFGDPFYYSIFEEEYRIVVAPDGWVKLYLPLRTAEYGRVRNLHLTVYDDAVRLRNLALVP